MKLKEWKLNIVIVEEGVRNFFILAVFVCVCEFMFRLCKWKKRKQHS